MVDQVADYQLEELIAQGGMGEIWRSRDAKFVRDLAIKVLRADRKDDDAMVARFLRETDLAGSLEHPSIPPVYDRGVLRDGRTRRAVGPQGRKSYRCEFSGTGHTTGNQRYLVVAEAGEGE